MRRLIILIITICFVASILVACQVHPSNPYKLGYDRGFKDGCYDREMNKSDNMIDMLTIFECDLHDWGYEGTDKENAIDGYTSGYKDGALR